MSRVLHYDCPSGLSGDMNLAALISLGVPVDYLKRELSHLDIGEFELQVREEMKEGIRGVRVDVLEPGMLDECSGHSHDHAHGHSHSHEGHGEGHSSHHHRSFGDIRLLLE